MNCNALEIEEKTIQVKRASLDKLRLTVWGAIFCHLKK